MVTNIFSSSPGYDTTIWYTNPNTNYNADNTLRVGTSNGDARALLKMDLSKISKNAIINDATLFLRVAQANVNLGTIYLRNVLRNWSLTQATYNIYSTGNAWEVPGAKGATETDGVCASVAGGAHDLYDEIEIPIDVSYFTKLINGSQVNNGWLIYTTSGEIFFISSNFGGAYIPRLEVHYEVPIISSAIFL